MKNIYIALATSAFIAFTSCSEEDDYGTAKNQEYEVIHANVSADFDSGITVSEDDSSVRTVTVTLESPAVNEVNIHVNINPETTAIEGEDFEIPSVVTIPEGEESVSFDVVILDDCDSEDSEVLSFTVGDDYFVNYSITPQTYTITIDNVETDDISIVFDWEGETVIDVDGQSLTFSNCDIADLDLYIYDVVGMDTGIYDAATGACPEEITLTGNGLSDGAYTLVIDNYAYTTTFGTFTLPNAVDLPFSLSAEGCGTGFLDVANYSSAYATDTAIGTKVEVASFDVVNGDIANFMFVNQD